MDTAAAAWKDGPEPEQVRSLPEREDKWTCVRKQHHQDHVASLGITRRANAEDEQNHHHWAVMEAFIGHPYHIAAAAAAAVAAVAAVVEAVIGCPFNIDVQPSCLTVLQISEGGQRVPGRAYIKFALDFVSGPTQFPMLPSSGAHVTILYSWEHNDDWALYWQRMIQCEALCVPKRRSILLSAARTGS